MDFLKELLAALGGGMVIFVAFLTFGKSIVDKYIDKLMETSAEKNLKKLENRFARSMTAYEILLRKEFDYYEGIDTVYAELIVRVQDCCCELLGKYDKELSERMEHAKEELTFLLQHIPILKSKNLQYQPYIPQQVFESCAAVVVGLQNAVTVLFPELKKLSQPAADKVDTLAVKNVENEILMLIAMTELTISKRLKELSETD